MNAPAPRRIYRLFDFVPHAVSAIAVTVGVLVLIGWIFDFPLFKSVLPGLVSMKVNTAVGFILSGIALWSFETGVQGRPLRAIAQACAALVMLLSILTLLEYLSGADLGIDQLLIREVTHLPGDIPGRMAVNTALGFAGLGAALLLLSLGQGGRVAAIHALAVVPIILGGSALIGYGYDIEDFLRERLNYTPMSINAATVFVLLAVGILNARADYPLRRFATGNTPAGVMVRRLLPAAVAFTVATGWLILQGYHAGYFDETFLLALFTAVNIAGLAALILGIAGKLYDTAIQRERMEQALRENEEQLNTIINILPTGLWMLDAAGKVAFGNPAAQRIWAGVRYIELDRLGEYKGWRVDNGQPIGAHEWAGARAFEKGETCIEEEVEIECFDGTHKIILDSAVPLRNPDGSIRGAITVNQDITERRRIADELRKSVKEIEDLYDHAPCGYHSLDENGVVTRINHTELAWLGFSRDEVIGKLRFPDLLTPSSLQTFQENFPRFKQNGYVHDLEFELKRKDGSLLPVLLSATAIYDPSGRYVMSRSTLFDLTDRKKLERELEQQARKDMLTGLNNRRHFFELAELELTRARRHGKPFSLLMLDLDNFKSVNDTYGHHIGDVALKKLGEVAMRTLREIDIVGRLGGEEFAGLLPETNGAQAQEVAERLRQEVERAAVKLEDDSALHFTVSIGLASLQAADADVDSVLKRADAALYRAKHAGRNRVCKEEME
ncbi:hypothetical protein MIZ01_0791 [Sideroxyarcus emersonii]|uniref:Diguanylate cyclase n=1 Tax=Sideroxyarcus emersonii TaxID=2764705 RepID=A0AAN2BYH0_9PROT|nr:diguanylate cyclase [Sideroxyarcus emersonii]BCK87021.1 hypothetical protein MIZ01_0791 [Sideroxyarcus emersonii]